MTISLRLTRGCRALAFINETVSYYPCAFIGIIKYIFDPNVFVKTEKSFKSKLYFLLSIEKKWYIIAKIATIKKKIIELL